MQPPQIAQSFFRKQAFFKKLGIAVVSATLAACGGNNAARTIESAPQEPAPALWLLSDDDSRVYLFGAIHMLPPSVHWRNNAYLTAMQASQITITEADTTSPKAIATIQNAAREYGLNPPGVTLTQRLGEERSAVLKEITDALGLPIASLEPMRPWLALVTLTNAMFQQAGYSPVAGIEAVVLEQAAAEGDQISHLETAAFQIETLAALDGAGMLASFDTTIDQFREFDAVTDTLVSAWRKGDIKGLEESIIAPLRDASPEAFELLFTQRNIAWVKTIEEMLSTDMNFFIAVGAGHLVGKDSVIDLLEAKGYQLKRIQ